MPLTLTALSPLLAHSKGTEMKTFNKEIEVNIVHNFTINQELGYIYLLNTFWDNIGKH